jgi:hypothetical protein
VLYFEKNKSAASALEAAVAALTAAWVGYKIAPVGQVELIVDTARGFINDLIDVLNVLPFVNIKHIGASVGKSSKGNPNIPAQKLAQGGKVTHPIAIMGEEAPTHPEWVIPTNPAYRKRAVGLWMQSAKSLGIPGFALGGALKKVGGAASSIVGKLPGNPFPTRSRASGATCSTRPRTSSAQSQVRC